MKKTILFVTAMLLLCVAASGFAQQKGQYIPGQYGLNGGVIPDPGFTYQNLVLNYSADQLNNSNGDRVPGIAGTYAFWLDENIFMYVSKRKILGAHFAPYVSLSVANGSLVAEIVGTNLSGNGGSAGLADTLVQPLNLGWRFSRADIIAGYGFVAPTGRYKVGASDNVGSGYWGHMLSSGTTLYLTKNKTTTASLNTNWEFHGSKKVAASAGQSITPGQTFTTEWGVGQVLVLDKQMKRLVQLGFVGYDQWQVTANSGTLASALPYYSAHALGLQANFVEPAKGVNLFFKYYDEVEAQAHTKGRSFVFGCSVTLKSKAKN